MFDRGGGGCDVNGGRQWRLLSYVFHRPGDDLDPERCFTQTGDLETETPRVEMQCFGLNTFPVIRTQASVLNISISIEICAGFYLGESPIASIVSPHRRSVSILGTQRKSAYTKSWRKYLGSFSCSYSSLRGATAAA